MCNWHQIPRVKESIHPSSDPLVPSGVAGVLEPFPAIMGETMLEVFSCYIYQFTLMTCKKIEMSKVKKMIWACIVFTRFSLSP